MLDASVIATSTKLQTTYNNLQSLTIIDNVSPSVGYKTSLDNLPVLKWQNKRIKEENEHDDIDVNYPQFLGGTMVNSLNEYIANIVKSIIEDSREESEIIANDPNEVGYGVLVSSDYRVAGVQNGIISLELVVTNFTDRGNGNHDWPYTINWDLKSNRLLSVDDLFCNKDYIARIAPLFRSQIIADAKLNGHVLLGIESGPNNNLENWEYFLLYKDGLISVFPAYQISSGSDGIIRTFIHDSKEDPFLCLP